MWHFRRNYNWLTRTHHAFVAANLVVVDVLREERPAIFGWGEVVDVAQPLAVRLAQHNEASQTAACWGVPEKTLLSPAEVCEVSVQLGVEMVALRGATMPVRRASQRA